MSTADSYRILGLSIGASQPDVRSAYHKLVRQWHPDKFHHDPDKQQIAELKIREIISAYRHLGESELAQRDADELPEDTSDADRSGDASGESGVEDAFYSNLEEAIRSGRSTFAGQPQGSRAAASTRQQAAAESLAAGREACAYVGGDPRFEHLASGVLGCSAVVAWNSAGLTLSTTGAASVAYPARSIRSVQMARRSALAFLSEGTVRIQFTASAGVGRDGFWVKLRFPDRYTAESFARQLEATFAVETCVDKSRPQSARLLLLLLVVLAGLGISIALVAKRDRIMAEPAQRPVVTGNEAGDKDQRETQITAVAQQSIANSDAGVQAAAVTDIERSGGSVIQIHGKVLRVKLAGARVNESLLTHISRLPDLEELNLHATTMTGEEFRSLSKLSNLRILDLGSTRNASAGFKFLTGLTRLQILRLSNTDVGDAELKLLQQLPDLLELEVIGTQVTELGIDQFNALRPDCVVVK